MSPENPTFGQRVRGALTGGVRGIRDGFRYPMVTTEESRFQNSPDIPSDPLKRYMMLEAFRDNLAYRTLKTEMMGLASASEFNKIRALENPCQQAVEFHVLHALPGTLEAAIPFDLPVDDALGIAAYRVLRDGRFGVQKDYAVEMTATCGDSFLQAVTSPKGDSVYPEVVDPHYVTDFEEDPRGNLTYIRLDWEDPDSELGEVYTEVYDKEPGLYTKWHHLRGIGGDVEDETPVEGYPVTMTSLGHDFVPFVRLPFRQSFARGVRCRGVFEPHLELVVQMNRDLTSHSDRYFRYGKPAMQVRRGEAGQAAIDMQWDPKEDMAFENENGKFAKEEPLGGGETFLRMPGLSYLEYLVPNIDWSAGLAQIERHRESLGRSMSEIRFFDGVNTGDPSGTAIEKHQEPSFRRAQGLRSNAEEAVLAVVKMCLSIGQRRGIYSPSLGSYENRDFDRLTIKTRPMTPETEAQKHARETAATEKYVAAREVSPVYLKQLLLSDGFDEETADEIVASSSETNAGSLASVFGGGGILTQ